ncbi:MAG: hypothetical protein AAGI28_08380 [Pseudomonadota bacterium]
MHANPLPFIATLAVFTAAACAPAEDGSADPENGTAEEAAVSNSSVKEAILMADTGWLSVGSDGTVQTTFFDPDGRYRDFRNGESADVGAWQQRPDGSICFTPDQGMGDCWKTDGREADGSAVVTSTSGKRVVIKQITYAAPKVSEEDTSASE